MPEQLEAYNTVPNQSAPSGTLKRQNTTNGSTALRACARVVEAKWLYETLGGYEFGETSFGAGEFLRRLSDPCVLGYYTFLNTLVLMMNVSSVYGKE
jgi:hypothetical protein